MVAYAYHDSILGHGRYTDNPTSYDEIRSAQLVERHLTQAGCTQDDMPRKAYVGVHATRFNQRTFRQSVEPSLGYGHIQVVTAGADLCEFPNETCVSSAAKVAMEDGYRMAFGSPFGFRAEELGRHQQSLQEGVSFINNDPALRQWFGMQLSKSARFCATHEYPDGWLLDDHPKRTANAATMMSIGENILQGMSVAEAAKHVLH